MFFFCCKITSLPTTPQYPKIGICQIILLFLYFWNYSTHHNNDMKMRKIALFATLLIFSFEFSILHSQKTLLSPSAALKTLEIRDGRCQEESLHAFVTLAEGTDLKAVDAYGVKVNSIVPLSHHSSLIIHHFSTPGVYIVKAGNRLARKLVVLR